MDKSELIYDWNVLGLKPEKPQKKIEFDDETLRDGIQSPSIQEPSISDKIKILNLMDALNIDSADIGLPGAGARVAQHVTVLAQEILENKLNIKASCAARTVEADITPIIEISQKVGIPICVDMFIGSSSIRRYAEDWSIERMIRNTEGAVKLAKKYNLPVMYVTEDTTRSNPETLRILYKTAMENGADRICVCDTVGHATPYGIYNLITYVKHLVKESKPDTKIDFHGHRDRGLSLINTLTSVVAGADRIHGCGQGIGERSGNTSMDHLLVNMKLLGWIDNDLTKLPEYCKTIAKSCDIDIPNNYPIIGEDAFRTGTGVHATAIIKAYKKEDDKWLADSVYSGVPASIIGREQIIEVGPMSGKSNVIFWLEKNGYEKDPLLIEEIFKLAKSVNKTLKDKELRSFIAVYQASEIN